MQRSFVQAFEAKPSVLLPLVVNQTYTTSSIVSLIPVSPTIVAAYFQTQSIRTISKHANCETNISGIGLHDMHKRSHLYPEPLASLGRGGVEAVYLGSNI